MFVCVHETRLLLYSHENARITPPTLSQICNAMQIKPQHQQKYEKTQTNCRTIKKEKKNAIYNKRFFIFLSLIIENAERRWREELWLRESLYCCKCCWLPITAWSQPVAPHSAHSFEQRSRALTDTARTKGRVQRTHLGGFTPSEAPKHPTAWSCVTRRARLGSPLICFWNLNV